MLAFYHCIGEYDGVNIYEVPDQSTVEALLLDIRAPSYLEKLETTELYTVALWKESQGKSAVVPGAIELA